MKYLALSDDLVSVKEFRTNLASWFRKASETGRPVVVTQHGKATAVVLSPRALDDLQEEQQFMRAVVRGLRSIEEGRLVEDEEVWKRVDQMMDKIERPDEDPLE